MVLVLYLFLAYWATGKTIYANRILIGTWQGIFFQRIAVGFLLGWILIPISIIKMFIS